MPAKQQPGRRETIKTLVTSFRYPRLGPGQMWDRCREQNRRAWAVKSCSATACAAAAISAWTKAGKSPRATPAATSERSRRPTSSARRPIREMARMIEPALPARVIAATDALKYRDFLTVALIMRDRTQPSATTGFTSTIRAVTRRPDSELQIVVAGSGAGSVDVLLRPRILLLRGRRAVDVVATRSLIALADAGARAARARDRRRRARRVRRPAAQGVSGLRRRLRRARRDASRRSSRRTIRACISSAATACTSTTIRITP